MLKAIALMFFESALRWYTRTHAGVVRLETSNVSVIASAAYVVLGMELGTALAWAHYRERTGA